MFRFLFYFPTQGDILCGILAVWRLNALTPWRALYFFTSIFWFCFSLTAFAAAAFHPHPMSPLHIILVKFEQQLSDGMLNQRCHNRSTTISLDYFL